MRHGIVHTFNLNKDKKIKHEPPPNLLQKTVSSTGTHLAGGLSINTVGFPCCVRPISPVNVVPGDTHKELDYSFIYYQEIFKYSVFV